MKIAVICNVWNDTDYLEFSLGSVKEFVDKVVVVSSRDRWGQRCLSNGCSDHEIVKKVFSGYDYEYRCLGDVLDLGVARNLMLSLVPRDFDWVWVVDSDEVYSEDEIIRLKGFLETAGCDAVHLWFHHFWLSFNRRDIGEYHVERVYRNIPGLSFNEKHNVASYADGRRLEEVDGKTKFFDGYFFHYGYVRPLPKIVSKMRRTFLQNIELRGEVSVGRNGVDIDDEVIYRLNHWFCPEYMEGVTAEFPLIKHPSIMRNHKWYGKAWQEVYLNF